MTNSLFSTCNFSNTKFDELPIHPTDITNLHWACRKTWTEREKKEKARRGP